VRVLMPVSVAVDVRMMMFVPMVRSVRMSVLMTNGTTRMIRVRVAVMVFVAASRVQAVVVMVMMPMAVTEVTATEHIPAEAGNRES